MKCKKCGEEITEGTLCEKCKKSKNTKIIEISVIVVLLLAVLGIVGWKVLRDRNTEHSNTGANLYNYGYAVEDNNYIFYAIPDKNAEYMDIYRMKKDGTNNELICDKDWNVASLNIVGDWLYFIGYEKESDESTSSETTVAKIYKMRTNGKDIKELTSDVTTQSYQITVIKNEIYYINDEYQICKISTNGGESSLVSEDKNGFVTIDNGWIYYADYDTDNYVMKKMKLDGSEKTEITGEVMYDINIVKNDIYYANSEGLFCKVSVNGGEVTKLSENAVFNLNVSDNYAYYMRYENPDSEDYVVGLYRVKLDGTGEEKIKTFKNYSSFLNVVGDWIMYSDNDEQYGYMAMVKKDGSEDKNIYTFDFGTIEDDSTTTEPTETQEPTETPVPEEVNE